MLDQVNISIIIGAQPPDPRFEMSEFLRRVQNRVMALFGLDTHYDVTPGKTDGSTAAPLKQTDFLIRTIDGRRYVTIRRPESPAQRIIYPTDEGMDVWQRQALRRFIDSVEKMYGKDGHFSICALDDVISCLGLSKTSSTVAARDHLRTIHCVNFSDLHQEIVDIIPRYITHILSEGRVSLDDLEKAEDLTVLEEEPEVSHEKLIALELSKITTDALEALGTGASTPEDIEALRARHIKALGRMLETWGPQG